MNQHQNKPKAAAVDRAVLTAALMAERKARAATYASAQRPAGRAIFTIG